MSVSLEAKEIAPGDYSPEYGTVAKAEISGDEVAIEFKNGHSLRLGLEDEIEIDQGGRFNHNGKSVG